MTITFNEVKVARKFKGIGVAHKVNFKTNPALKKSVLQKAVTKQGHGLSYDDRCKPLLRIPPSTCCSWIAFVSTVQKVGKKLGKKRPLIEKLVIHQTLKKWARKSDVFVVSVWSQVKQVMELGSPRKHRVRPFICLPKVLLHSSSFSIGNCPLDIKMLLHIFSPK